MKLTAFILAACLVSIRLRTDHTPTQTTTLRGDGDYVKFTAPTDIPTAESEVPKVAIRNEAGTNSDAFDVMYHLIVNKTDSGLDKFTPLADTYDAKVLYVFTDGIPNYLESTMDGCAIPSGSTGYYCSYLCGNSAPSHCCDYDYSTGVYSPLTFFVDYGPFWNSFADCPVDLASLGKKINDDDWYVAYIAGDHNPDTAYNWSKQVPMMGIESRFTSYGVDYSYTGLSD